MDNINFWKILRVLTTNACNYKCIFCHNEGQENFDGLHSQMLKFKDFKFIILALQDSGLKEIQFSGGEPFINPETIEMIMWANNNTNIEIGCASNTQFFNDEIIDKLSHTRIKLHIQFPTLNQKKFQIITGSDLYQNLHQNLKKLKNKNVEYSLNYVLRSQSVDDLKELLPFVIENNINIKILPFVNKNSLKKNDFKKNIFPFLSSLSYKHEIQEDGGIKWEIKLPKSKSIYVKYIDFPCFSLDFQTCKNYSEIRLLPDLTLQTCLIDNTKNLKIDFELCEENFLETKQLFQKAWKNFTHC